MIVDEDETPLSEETVRLLVHGQFPEWRGLPINRVDGGGTVNSIFRIGDDLAARFPLRGAAAATVRDEMERERAATARFAEHCPVAVPVTVAIGEPGHGYPLPWSVQTWVRGTVAADVDLGSSPRFAADLAFLVGRLRDIDTGGACFTGGNRGGDLRSHDNWMETCLRHTAEFMDVSVLQELWSRFRVLPRTDPDRMCHGDLIPGNVLVDADRLVGVLDAGGFGPADPALDLIAGWHLLDDGPRSHFRDCLDVADDEWRRGMAWAFEQSMGVIWYYRETNPVMSRMGRLTLERICAHAGQLG